MSRKGINGQLLDVATAAELLGVSQRSLRARVARGLVPYRKLDCRVVFRRDELEKFIQNLPGVTIEEARANAAMRNQLMTTDEVNHEEKGRALSCDGDRDSAKRKDQRNGNDTPIPRRNKTTKIS